MYSTATPRARLIHRNSAGFESVSTAASPPCYTSQLDPTSATPTLDVELDEVDGHGISFEQIQDYGGGMATTDSAWALNRASSVMYQLPSPYSTEDLRTRAPHDAHHHRQNQSASEIHRYTDGISSICTHGYTHIHSRCDSSSDSRPSMSGHEPLSSVAAGRSSSIFNVAQSPTASRLTHAENRRSSRRYISDPSSYSQTDLPSMPYGNRTSPYGLMVRQQQPIASSTGRHLVYLSHDPGLCESRNHVDCSLSAGLDHVEDDLIHTPTGNTDSTIACHCHDTPKLDGHTSGDPAAVPAVTPRKDNVTVKGSSAAAPTSRQPEPTNFVYLSRKSTFPKRPFFSNPFSSRRGAVNTSITGSFAIDPLLRVPDGLLRPIFELPGRGNRIEAATDVDEMQHQGDIKSSRLNKRKNLRLEVENGGIDVDIHLVAHQPQGDFAQTVAGSDGDLGCRTTMIELCLLENSNGEVKSRHTPFPLIARIHTPHPRLPFHILATTISTPRTSSRPSPTITAPSPTQPPNQHQHQQRHRKPSLLTRNPSSIPPQPVTLQPTSAPQSELNNDFKVDYTHAHKNNASPITLHLPRAFRGPLTVHVAAGDIDAHVWLSRELGERAVVIGESAFARVWFVGGLKAGVVTETGKGAGTADTLKVVCDYCGCLCRCEGGDTHGFCMTTREGAERGANVNESKDEGEGEWTGDRVDVVVGNGKVFLQYLDEKDAWGKGGWFKSRLVK